jgi:DNA-binding transcriptional LysR family regulator
VTRLDVNRSGEIEVFVRVVDLGGFSAAARAFQMTPSAVSKLMARLENRLGASLINRSIRKQQLTAEGAAFYDRALRILEDMATAEREAAAGAAPRGRLRVNSNVPFGIHYLLPLLPASSPNMRKSKSMSS